MAKYQINDRMGTGYHRLPDDDGWDVGDRYENHEIEQIRLQTSEDRWYDFENDLEVKQGDDVWLVYVLYQTGSTFGRTEGNIQYIDIFDNRQEAYDCVKLIKDDGPGEVEYTRNGEVRHKDVFGDDYFGRLENVCIKHFELR